MHDTWIHPRDLTFIIRSAGERTLAACESILRAQLRRAGGDADQVSVVAERPFSRAVRRTIQAGLLAGRPFVVGMDADVLLSSRGLANMLRACAAMKPGTFSLAGLVLCRFFGGYCFRGVHIYRREHLAPAVELVGVATPGGPDPDLKPETAVVEAMKARGYGFEALPLPLGVHDYEQHYRHIYLKMRLRARRQLEIDFREGGVQDLIDVCERGARGAGADAGAGVADRSGSDFVVARWGLEDGTADAARKRAGDTGVPGCYDWFAPVPEFDRRMEELGWREKPPMDPSSAKERADRVMAAHDVATDGRTPGWIRDHLLGRRAA